MDKLSFVRGGFEINFGETVMNTVKGLVVGASVLLAVGSGWVIADDNDGLATQTEVQTRTEKGDQLYGSQLMTVQERAEHRAKIHAAKTMEEREKIRSEQHERMKIRAKERGVTLADEAPKQGGKKDYINKGQGAGFGAADRKRSGFGAAGGKESSRDK